MLANLFHLLNCCLFGRKLEDLSVDEFLLSGFDSAGDSEEETPKQNGVNTKNKSKDLKSATSNMWVLFCRIIYLCLLFCCCDGNNNIKTSKTDKQLFFFLLLYSDEKKKGKASEHKEQLSRLKNKDPEFYKFLQQNDQTLLNFDDTDSSDDEDEKKYHKLPSALEVGRLLVSELMMSSLVKTKIFILACFACRRPALVTRMRMKMLMRVRKLRRNPRRQWRPSKSQTKWLKSGKQQWKRNPHLVSLEKSPRPLRPQWLQPRVKEGVNVDTKCPTAPVGYHVWYEVLICVFKL